MQPNTDNATDPDSADGRRRTQAAAQAASNLVQSAPADLPTADEPQRLLHDVQPDAAFSRADAADDNQADADADAEAHTDDSPAVKPPSTTASKMPASFNKSVQLLTALSNVKGGEVKLPPFIQNLPLFKNNGIDVTEKTLTAVRNAALDEKRKKDRQPGATSGPPPPPSASESSVSGATPTPDGTTTRAGMSTVVPLSLPRIGPWDE